MKIFRRILITILMFCLCVLSFAQTDTSASKEYKFYTELLLMPGYISYSLKTMNSNSDFVFMTNVNIGYKISNRFSVQTGLNYFQNKSVITGDIISECIPCYSGPYSREHDTKYFEFPTYLLINILNTAQKIQLYALTGLTCGLVYEEQKYIEGLEEEDDNVTTKNYNNYNGYFNAAIALNYKITKNLSFTFKPTYRYSFRNRPLYQGKQLWKHHLGIGLGMIYKFYRKK